MEDRWRSVGPNGLEEGGARVWRPAGTADQQGRRDGDLGLPVGRFDELR